MPDTQSQCLGIVWKLLKLLLSTSKLFYKACPELLLLILSPTLRHPHHADNWNMTSVVNWRGGVLLILSGELGNS